MSDEVDIFLYSVLHWAWPIEQCIQLKGVLPGLLSLSLALTLLLAIHSFQGEAGISTCSSELVEGGDKVVYKFSKVGGKYGEDGSQLVTAHIFCPSSELEKSCQGKFPSEVLHFHLISLSSSDHG